MRLGGAASPIRLLYLVPVRPVCYHENGADLRQRRGGFIVNKKIPVNVSLDPAVARAVAQALVRVAEVVLDPQVGDRCYTVTFCPGRPYAHSIPYRTYSKAERLAEVVRRLAWLAIEEYLRAQTTGPEVVALGDQALPAECHPDTPRQGPVPTSKGSHDPLEVGQLAELLRHPRDIASARPVGQANAGVHQVPVVQAGPLQVPDMLDSRVVGPDLFAGDLSAMGRLLVDIAAATARHALRVQDLKQAARSAAEGIDEVVTNLKLKGPLSSHAMELRQALARLEELEDR